MQPWSTVQSQKREWKEGLRGITPRKIIRGDGQGLIGTPVPAFRPTPRNTTAYRGWQSRGYGKHIHLPVPLSRIDIHQPSNIAKRECRSSAAAMPVTAFAVPEKYKYLDGFGSYHQYVTIPPLSYHIM
jgi:hypothetical protein